MDYQKFIQELPNFYHAWGEETIEPKSTRFAEVLTTIGRVTTANIMQLLNFAVSCLDTTEIYCEIGTNQGATLIGALLNNLDKVAYAIDDFASHDDPEESLLKLTDNLEKFQLSDQVYFYAQDCESFFFDLRAAATDDRLGVYFYDGSHDYRSQLMGLMLAREFLAEQALVIINNTNWGTTKQGIWDFLAINPEATLLLDLSTSIDHHPSFGNGLTILGWDCQNKSFPIDFDWQQYQAKQEKSVIIAIANLQTLEQQQSEARAIYLKALQLHAQGDLIIAEKYYQDFLLWNSDSFEGWYNLGLLYHAGERYPAAIGSFLKAQALNPEFIDLYSSLGNSLVALGETAQAINIYYQGINLHPHHVGCYLNLGNLLLAQGEIEEAIKIYRNGLEFNPDNLDLISNLQVAEEYSQRPEFLLATGHNFYYQGKYAQAISIYQKLLDLGLLNSDISPDILEPNLYFNCSEAHQRLQEFSQSIQVLQRGVHYHPLDPRLQFTLIIQLQQQDRIEEAIEQAKTAANLIPQDYVFQILQYLLVPMIYDSVAQIEFYKQRFQQGLNTLQAITKLETPEEINQAFLGISRVTNFYLAYQAHNVRDLQIQYGQLLSKIMAARFPAWVQDLPRHELGENQKIRVGYVSNYLCSYSGTYWLQGWLKLHNQAQLEIYCYHTGSTVDIVTHNFQQWSHSFYHLSANFEAVCEQILQDKLHILVFPEIGMDAPTMAMAGLRLAPIQCTAWGHPVTTGLGTIDYFLSSELMEPENAQDHYSETLVKLPNIGVAYPAPRDIPIINSEVNHPINGVISEVNPQVNSAINNQLYPESNTATTAPNIKTKSYFSLPEASVIYLCLQAPFKYLPQYDRIFPSIALQVPHAKFVFLRGELLQPRLDRAFIAQGLIYTDFCEFLKIPAREDYLWLNLVADVFLDTCTWSGGNTSLEAIACGLPLVTYPGEFMRGRHADSFLKMIGVTETIAEDVENYIEIAIRLGLDTSWRREIKTKMQHQQARLFDDPVCVTALEEFYLRQVLS
ncbi:MAG: tetratricopeptide repeat protein [Coleofasciculaceae cyanobacterium SM2_1_6]|nr:tetratricopeptide repeat protein [Coleofasciculaceae cyanobacterium SM2_1_6]